MNIKLSVIIPCYNQGVYLLEAINSVELCTTGDFEVIIINDGSTDEKTNAYCFELKNKGYTVIFQNNQGLPAARNAGIELSRGEFILTLDADNKVRPGYISKGIEILEANPDIDIVYGNASYFGGKTGVWKPGPFNLQHLMLGNYIDACAVIRKSIFAEIGSYDTNMKWGWEDWDLWLRSGFADKQFYYLDEICFDYRVVPTSMSKTLYENYQKPNEIENYIHSKYPYKMGHEWTVNHYISRFKKNPFLFLGKLILRAYFPGYYQRLLKRNKIRNGL